MYEPLRDPEWDPETLQAALLEDQDSLGWGAVTNLDAFFSKVYYYYVEEGFWCIVVTRATNLITLGFTIGFSTFLLLFVNWTNLFLCSSASLHFKGSPGEEGPCSKAQIVRNEVFADITLFELVVMCYFGIFAVYWLWNLIRFGYAVRDSAEMRHFFHHHLHISDDQLALIEWSQVVSKLVRLQERDLKLCIVKDLTALDITNRIMRRDNYMIALVNQRLLHFPLAAPWGLIPCLRRKAAKRTNVTAHTSLPSPSSSSAAAAYTPPILPTQSSSSSSSSSSPAPPRPSPKRAKPDRMLSFAGAQAMTSAAAAADPHQSYDSWGDMGSGLGGLDETDVEGSSEAVGRGGTSHLGQYLVFGKTLEWNLRFCVLNSMFDQQFSIRKHFLSEQGVRALQRRFILMGLLNLLLLPFIMIFMLIFFFLENAEELNAKKSVLGPRQWTPFAQWQIREFNELPHFFQRRTNLSQAPAQKYLSLYPSSLGSILAQCVAFISGAVVGTLALLTFIDSSVLLSIRLLGKSLLWWLAMCSAVLAASRGLIPSR